MTDRMQALIDRMNELGIKPLSLNIVIPGVLLPAIDNNDLLRLQLEEARRYDESAKGIIARISFVSMLSSEELRIRFAAHSLDELRAELDHYRLYGVFVGEPIPDGAKRDFVMPSSAQILQAVSDAVNRAKGESSP